MVHFKEERTTLINSKSESIKSKKLKKVWQSMVYKMD